MTEYVRILTRLTCQIHTWTCLRFLYSHRHITNITVRVHATPLQQTTLANGVIQPNYRCICPTIIATSQLHVLGSSFLLLCCNCDNCRHSSIIFFSSLFYFSRISAPTSKSEESNTSIFHLFFPLVCVSFPSQSHKNKGLKLILIFALWYVLSVMQGVIRVLVHKCMLPPLPPSDVTALEQEQLEQVSLTSVSSSCGDSPS